jgi:myo-inositol 2-dehydrogenase/D-chiro-inositol 1-dehydrogenase
MINKDFQLGLIGAGRIGKMHTQNIINKFQNINLKSIADPSIDKEWFESLDIENCYTNPDKIIYDKEIHAVIITSPTPTHINFIKKCANNKKHIFCEKPIALTINEIKEVIDVVEKNNVFLQVGLNRRFDHHFLKMKQELHDGSIGTPHTIHITNRDSSIPKFKFLRSSGGLLLDMSIHDFDMVQYLTGSNIKEIFVNGNVFIEPKLKELGDIDMATITLELDNDIICSIQNSRQTHYGYDQRIEIFGSKGMLVVENENDSLCYVINDSETKHSRLQDSFIERYKQSFIAELDHFFSCLQSGELPIVCAQDILSAVQVAIAGQKSIKQNQPQRVNR